jgi:hypothetical protein
MDLLVQQSGKSEKSDPLVTTKSAVYPERLRRGSPNFFSLRATLNPPLSPKGQDLVSSSYQHTVVLNYAQIFVLGLARGFFPLSALLICVKKHSPK